jgi:hypothetical protein
MGVGFAVGHDLQFNASFSYTGFARFRRMLAAHEGFDLDTMSGFGGTTPWRGVGTPLRPLLNHADDRGHIGPKNCGRVAARLREVVPAIWPDPRDTTRLRAEALADAMEKSADTELPLRFH